MQLESGTSKRIRQILHDEDEEGAHDLIESRQCWNM